MSKWSRYTITEIGWLKDKLSLKKYRTRTGKIRAQKLRNAYETHFHKNRSVAAIAYLCYKILGRYGLGLHNPAPARVKNNPTPTIPLGPDILQKVVHLKKDSELLNKIRSLLQ